MATVIVAEAGALRCCSSMPSLLLWNSARCGRSSLSVSGVRVHLSSSPRATNVTKGFHSSTDRGSQSRQRRMTYRVAVSSTGKGNLFSPERNIYGFDPEVQDALGLQNGKSYTERKKSRPDSGEDAFFVSKVGKENNAVAFGVADGVGGWTESGVDPADFSHALCSYMARSALDWDSPADKLRGKALMQSGYEKCLSDRSIFAGGSTASIGIAQEDGKLELTNLGDSGSILFRLGAVHHYSNPQTHAFNTPYQLSLMPPLMRAQAAMFGGRGFEDLPFDASVMNCTLKHGDVLLLATDGVLDNLFNQDILNIVTRRMMATGAWSGTSDMGIGVSDQLDALTRPGGLATPPSSNGSSASSSPTPPDPKTRDHTLQALLALTIAGQSKLAGMDFRRDGPFAKESQRYFPREPWRGGKEDDICALVVIAVEEGRDGS